MYLKKYLSTYFYSSFLILVEWALKHYFETKLLKFCCTSNNKTFYGNGHDYV